MPKHLLRISGLQNLAQSMISLMCFIHMKKTTASAALCPALNGTVPDKIHKVFILLVFGQGLQIIIYLIIWASRPDMLILLTPQGAAACYVHYISMSGLGGQSN